jgi:hypothetical protein
MEIFKNLGGDLFSCIVGGIIIFFVLILKEFVTWGIQKRKQDSETDIDLVNEFRKTHIALEEQSEKIEEICNSIESIKRSLESLKTTADLCEKYCIPSKEDRDLRDQIDLDNEHFSRLGKGSEKLGDPSH